MRITSKRTWCRRIYDDVDFAVERYLSDAVFLRRGTSFHCRHIQHLYCGIKRQCIGIAASGATEQCSDLTGFRIELIDVVMSIIGNHDVVDGWRKPYWKENTTNWLWLEGHIDIVKLWSGLYHNCEALSCKYVAWVLDLIEEFVKRLMAYVGNSARGAVVEERFSHEEHYWLNPASIDLTVSAYETTNVADSITRRRTSICREAGVSSDHKGFDMAM